MTGFENLYKKLLEDATPKSVVILPGGFKPPHKGHFNALKYLISKSNADQAIVYIGKSIRDNITAEQSLQIWDLYKNYFNKKIDVLISPITPVKSVYEYCDLNPQNTIYVGAGEEDQDRFSYFQKNKDRYTNVNIVSIPPQFGRISGTETRKKIAANTEDAAYFIPDEISQEDSDKIKKILSIG
jgi:ATP sulfurylase